MSARKMSLKERQGQFMGMILAETPQDDRETIYAHAYRIRFEESLREDFPVAIALDTDFAASFSVFCGVFGSESWSLNHLAQRWMEFLLAENLKPQWLLDLYQLEALQFQSYFLDEKSPLELNELHVFDEVILAQQRAFIWMTSAWNIEEVWQNEEPPLEKNFSLTLFFRDQKGPTFVTVEGPSAHILQHLLTAKNLEGLPEKWQNSAMISEAFAHLAGLFSVK